MSRAHAILSASGAKRWMSCPPSALLEQGFDDKSSEFAAEGTAAHALAELKLQKYLSLISPMEFKRELKKLQAGPYYGQEMEDYTDQYLDAVIERINEALARTPDAIVMIEQRLDFSKWVPEGFGTGDVLIIADEIMDVIDLKYGKGVPVYAEENPQMRLYGLGALHAYQHLYDIAQVRMTIMQPRLDVISTDEMDAKDLELWGWEVVKPLAQMAINGEGNFYAGDHCRFCKAKAQCRARAEEALEMARYEFRQPPLLSNEEIGEILQQAEELQKWAADVQSYALEQAEKHGVKFPGWKLVEGRSNRKYVDEPSIMEVLIQKQYDEDLIAPRSILGITAMEKAIGKKNFETLLNDLIIKPAGKPVLVKEADKRPEINSTASAVEDFK